MAALDDALTALQAVVQAQEDVDDSATALINGIQKMISDAVAAALAAAPLTPAQQAIFADLQTKLTAKTTALSAAVVANTPAAS